MPTPPPPTRFSIKVTKQTAYKGGLRDWSNRYFWTGANPSNSGARASLLDAIILQEKNVYPTSTTIVEGVAYDAGSDVPVETFSRGVHGVVVPAGGSGDPPLETCGLMRFATDQRTVKNHPIYLFKYYHDTLIASGSDRELLEAGLKSNMESVADAFLAGFSVDGSTRHLCGPYGAVAQSRLVHQFVTHRDFPA